MDPQVQTRHDATQQTSPEDKMAQTTQCEEERWLTQRWLDEESRWVPSTGTGKARNDGSKINQGMRPSDVTNESICRPTLEKLYAAQRKQRRDLERQIEEAMTGKLK